MSKKIAIVISVLIGLGLIGVAAWFWLLKPAEPVAVNNPTTSSNTTPTNQTTSYKEYTSLKGVKLRLNEPLSGATVTSPLKISGQVPGSWSFEASFPVKLVDQDQKEIASGHATLQGDWMTDDYVPFTAQLTFTAPTAKAGYLILQKDNPSGDAAKDDSATIEVKF